MFLSLLLLVSFFSVSQFQVQLSLRVFNFCLVVSRCLSFALFLFLFSLFLLLLLVLDFASVGLLCLYFSLLCFCFCLSVVLVFRCLLSVAQFLLLGFCYKFKPSDSSVFLINFVFLFTYMCKTKYDWWTSLSEFEFVCLSLF